MSGYTHPFSGPQDPSAANRHGTGPNQSRDARNFSQQLPARAYSRPHNNTGPIFLGSPAPQFHPNYPSPAQTDMPPYRPQQPDPISHKMHSTPRPMNPRYENYSPPVNTNYNRALPPLDPLQPPELPPKNISGLQVSPEPQRYPPPPLPARPTPHLAPDTSPNSREPHSSEKKPSSGRVHGEDPDLSDRLEELKRDPLAAAERFKRVAEVLSTWPKRYEAGLHMKTKRLQESVTNAQQDLDILKEELHKARSALSASQTGSHVLKGQLQILEQENVMLRNELSKAVSGDGETDFGDEETQLLISDLRGQIVKLKSEVPDPNFIESLHLIIQLLQEDKKILEKKYTEVSDELHYRDNEISRLMKENQMSGSIIPEGKTGLEKHFDSQMEDFRRQNHILRQQLQITQQKLEVSEKRESAENEPGPSKVELQNMIQHANEYRVQLQAKMDGKDEELRQLKKQLESSREVISSACTRGAGSANCYGTGTSADAEGRLREQVLALENDLAEQQRARWEGPERELRAEREKVLMQEGRIAQLEASASDSMKDTGKEALMKTLLEERNTLMRENEVLRKEKDETAPLRDGIAMLRNYLEGRDAHIRVLNDVIEKKSQECSHFRKQYEEFNLRSKKLLDFGNEVNEEKVQLESVIHKYKQRIGELEGKLSSIQQVAPSATTAAEVYEVQMMEMSKDLSGCEQERKLALDKCCEVEKKNEQMTEQLQQLSIECATLKNQSHLGPRYNYAYHGYPDTSGRPRPSYPPAASSGSHGHGPGQPRDPGVAYP